MTRASPRRVPRLYPPPRWPLARTRDRARDPDQALLRRIACDEEAAFRTLYERWYGKLSRFTTSRLGQRAYAEECTQEIFLRIWRSAGSYDPGKASPTTWIYTIARNAVIDQLRSRSRPLLDQRDPAWVPSSSQQPCDEELVQREIAAKVRAAVQQLPSAQAEVLTKSYFYHLTSREIAEESGIPVGTVKSRTRLAMERLRRALRWEQS